MRRVLVLAGVLVTGACSTFAEGTDPSATGDGGTPPVGADAAIDGGASDGATCPNASCIDVIASGQAKADEVLVDDQRVYWTIDDESGTVMAREHDAGATPRAVTRDPVRPRSLLRAGDHLQFASGGAVRHIERYANGGGLSLSAQLVVDPITSIARAGGKLFATGGDAVLYCNLDGDACPNLEMPFSHSVGPGARALTADATRVWLATDTSIWKTEIAAPSWLEWWPLTKARAIAVDETSVFVARTGERGITKFGRDADRFAPPTVIAPDAPPAWAIALDGADVFYTAIDDNQVIKVSKDGASVKVLAANVDRPKGIGVRLDQVYVALGDGRIVALPRN